MKGTSRGGDMVLAVDCGTQSVKAVVLGMDGRPAAFSQKAHAPNSTPAPLFVEHDAEDYWKNTRAAVGEALASLGKKDLARLKAVGLTAQRGTVVPVDAAGRPTRPAIYFADTRRNEGLPKLGGVWGALFKLMGLYSAISYVRDHSWYTWIKLNQPDIYEKTATFMQVASFLTHRLTGETAESIGNMVGMFPFDTAHMKFFPQRGVQDIFGVRPEILPPLKAPSSVMGCVTPRASRATGIPAGLPVIVGGGDMQAAMIGMGAVEAHLGAMVLGSASILSIPSKKYVKDKKDRYFSWTSAVRGEWVLECGLKAGFTTVNWFMDEIAAPESQIAAKKGAKPEEVLEREIRKIPPGSLGLLVQPYWNPPFHRDEWARGTVLGFTLAHRRAHLYRAMLEGMIYDAREGYEAMRETAGARVSEMRVCGGGSKSDTVLDIIANVFGVPVVCMEMEEASALGAAVCAAYGSGLVSSLGEGIARMVRPARRFEPDGKKVKTYDRLFKEYRKIYPLLTGLYRDTADLARYG